MLRQGKSIQKQLDTKSENKKFKNKQWKAKDPNVKYRNYLLENKIATEEELVELEKTSKSIIDDAVEFAKESPFADPEIAFQDNYAD